MSECQPVTNINDLPAEERRKVLKAERAFVRKMMDPEGFKERSRAACKRYRETHPEVKNAASKRYRARHPDRVRKTAAVARKKNPEAHRRHTETYRKKHADRLKEDYRRTHIGAARVVELMSSVEVPRLPSGVHTIVDEGLTHTITADGSRCVWTIADLRHFYTNPRTGTFTVQAKPGARPFTFTCPTSALENACALEDVGVLETHLRILKNTVKLV